MFRFTYPAIGRYLITVVWGVVFLSQTSATCQESSTGIAKELEIMSKVLEASLDASGIEDWHASSFGYSAFQSKIKREYIPTVGAIFTIDVNFPVVKPEEEVAKASEGVAKPQDLWEQMSEGHTSTRDEITGIGVSLLKNDQGEIVVVNTIIGSPAANADISQYDVIIEVEGNPTGRMNLNQVAKLIGGEEGSAVALKIRGENESDEAATELNLVREKIRTGTNNTFHFDPQVWETATGGKKEGTRIRSHTNPSGHFNQQGWDSESQLFRIDNDRKTLYVPVDRSNQSRFQLLQADDLNLTMSGDYFFHEIEYDAKKVGTLRDTLIAAVARYGHRMTQVGDEERILIIVNAPRGGSSKRLVNLDEQKRGYTYFPVASHGDRDHILFSFAQSDLKEETSPEVLKQVLQEVSY